MEIIHIEVEKINTAIIRGISNHHNQLSINTIEHGNFLAKQPTNLVLDINDIGLSTTTLQLQLKVLHTLFYASIILFFLLKPCETPNLCNQNYAPELSPLPK